MRCPTWSKKNISGGDCCCDRVFVACLHGGAAPGTTASSTKIQSTAAANPPSYAEESIVLDSTESVYTYAPDGTGTLKEVCEVRVQSDAAVKALGVISVAYAANSQRVEFTYVRVRHPDGSVVETPVTDLFEISAHVTQEAPFYSDLKAKQLPVRT